MKKLLQFLFIILSCISFTGLHAQQRKKPAKKETTAKKSMVRYGIASFYAIKFHGRKTANGETHSREQYSAACNIFPLNSWIKVTNLKNNKTVIVKINDRLHSKNKRLLDLSKSAAEKLGYVSRGLTRVKAEVLNNFSDWRCDIISFFYSVTFFFMNKMFF